KSLDERAQIAVMGILDPALLPIPPPAGKTLLGAAMFDPESLPFDSPLPVLHIPVRSEWESQLSPGETFDLFFFDGSGFNGHGWVDTTFDGTVETNPQYFGRRSVGGTVKALHLYAAFIGDIDGD